MYMCVCMYGDIPPGKDGRSQSSTQPASPLLDIVIS